MVVTISHEHNIESGHGNFRITIDLFSSVEMHYHCGLYEHC